MEPATRFNLSHAIREWRGELQQQAGLGEAAVRELEQHLTESMEALRLRGLDDAEAFLVARHRVGPAARLGEEFRKADLTGVWRDRILWMVAGWGIMMLWGGLMSPVQSIAVQRISPAGTTVDPLFQIGLVLSYLILGLLPLGLALLIARGRFVDLAERLMPLFASRRRAGVVVAILSTLILGAGQLLMFAWGPLHSYGFPGFGMLAVLVSRAAIQGTLFGLTMAWLMPKPHSAQVA